MEDTYEQVGKNFTTFLLSYGSINIDKSLMSASRIGTCSSNLKLTKTILNADGRGCPNDQGISKGTLVSGCAASGGGHGGSGGFGSKLAIDESDSRCRNGAPQGYPTQDTDAQFEGSGGGSSNELLT